MNNTVCSGTVEGNKTGASQAQPQPIPSRKDLGREGGDASNLGAGNPSSSGSGDDRFAANPGPGFEGTPEDLIADQDDKTFLTYRGQRIQVVQVAYMSGTMTDTPWMDHDGDENILLDETTGQYYLRRELTTLDCQREKRDTSGRTLVHRLSPKAAVLWATMRANATGWDLRNEALALMEPAAGFTLDAHAAKMLREHATANPHHDPRDIVNAAVCYMLATDADFPEVVDEAKARFLNGELPVPSDPATVEARCGL